MSNIKEIDGVFVKLDRVQEIFFSLKEKGFCICFTYSASVHDCVCGLNGKIFYKTEEEAENRIREIIKNQNERNKNER